MAWILLQLQLNAAAAGLFQIVFLLQPLASASLAKEQSLLPALPLNLLMLRSPKPLPMTHFFMLGYASTRMFWDATFEVIP
eukprot:1159846-Pelagomonas_calceolata.AAC.16